MKKEKILPPTYFLIFLLLIIGIHIALPVAEIVHFPLTLCGFMLIGFGILLNLWTDNLFKKYSTTVKPFDTSTHFIEEGPFRYTRNPMYLGMFFVLIGVSFLLGSLSPFILAMFFPFVVSFIFIIPEEKDLQETFGEDYNNYQSRVRRWL